MLSRLYRSMALQGGKQGEGYVVEAGECLFGKTQMRENHMGRKGGGIGSVCLYNPHRGINKRVKPLILPARTWRPPPVDKAAESLRQHDAPTDVRHRGLRHTAFYLPVYPAYALPFSSGVNPFFITKVERPVCSVDSCAKLHVGHALAYWNRNRPSRINTDNHSHLSNLEIPKLYSSPPRGLPKFYPKIDNTVCITEMPATMPDAGIWQGFQPSQ